MRKVKRLLVISPYSTYKSKFHFQNIVAILQKSGISVKMVDSHSVSTKFFALNKFKKHKKFNDFLEEFDPDFILLDDYFKSVNTIIKKKIPFLFLLRGDIWEEEKWAKETISKSFKQKLALKRRHKIYEICLNNAFAIIPISNFLKKIVTEKFPDKKIKVIHIDARVPEEWNARKNMKLKHPCVGLVQGAGIWGKTKELLLLKEILPKLPNVTFYWAGDGIYKDKILPSLENFENFRWLGNLDYPEKVQEFLTEIDVYALFSGIDGLGQSVIEASFMEKPVVVSKSGGIPETVEDGKTGYLVEPGDTQGWIDKLSTVLSNSEISKNLGANGREFVSRKFNWNVVSEEIIKIMRE